MGSRTLKCSVKVKHKKSTIKWLGMLVLTCLYQWSFQVSAAESGQWVSVDSASIEQSARYTKRGVGYYTYNSVALSDTTVLSDKLRLVITDSTHEIINADGIDDESHDYFMLDSVDEKKTIYFTAKRGAFSYNAELQEYIEETPSPEKIVFNYDFNENQIQIENNNWEGWVYPTKNRGVMKFEANAGNDGSAAYSFEDTSTNSSISQHGLRFNNRTNKANINPWTALLQDAKGKMLASVSLWVKVQKAIPGNVTIQHHLIPFPLIDDKKGPTITAGINAGPQYQMIIPASANNTWVHVEFVDTRTGQSDFTIPDSWVHYDGVSPIQVYPQFLFGGLEVGDKVLIDNYSINSSPITEACCDPIDDNTGGDNGNNTGGDNSSTGGDVIIEPTYTLGDELTFDYPFDVNDIATSQGAQGWIYSVKDRGVLHFEENGGRTGSAFSYTDTSVNVNPEQNGFYLQDWSANQFTARFANHGHIIKSVKLWVKTELETEKDIQIIHYLLPYGLVSGNKSTNYPAAVNASPKFVGTIPAGSVGWTSINLTLEDADSTNFTIPSTWVHYSGGDLQIYPEFKFGNTEVGDKIYLDDYQVITEVGEPLPIPTDFTIDYDFNQATVAQNGGWGFVLSGYGDIGIAENMGYQNSNGIAYVDNNAADNINNQSLLWHKWGATNPWSQHFGGGAIDTEIKKVTLRIKVEKATGNTGTEDVIIKHHLLPWNVTLTGGKLGKVTAAQAITADYTAKVSQVDFGKWVEVTFVDSTTNLNSFSIPESWVLTTGDDIVDVLPSFFFGGLEVGDKVIIDDYKLTGDNALARSANIGNTGSGGNEEPAVDYGLHDGSRTYSDNPRPTPLPVIDSDFYQEPSDINVTRNAVVDYGINNTDSADDTAIMQAALNDISVNLGGGKLIIPAGNYYFRGLNLLSNVHLEIAEGATFHMTPGGGYNVWMFDIGNGSQGQVTNFSMVGLGNGFTIDLRDAPNLRTAVFKMGDMNNFKFSNFTIEDRKSIFASFLVGVTVRDNDLYWPKNGIIENIDQRNSLFGYGLVQMYGADKILFRNLHSEGGITLRMETDNLSMKEYNKGGIRDIFAENISGTDCLAPVMFGPHFQENGSVQVDGVTSNGCGFAVRVDSGFVELFSPKGQTYTRDEWKTEVDATYGDGCSAQPYKRGANQWAARINPINDCLDNVHHKTNLKPGWFAESYIYNVTVNKGLSAHLKQNQLDYFETTNPTCENVCLPTKEQWSQQGQVYLGPSIGGVIDFNEPGVDYNFHINIKNLNMVDFSIPMLDVVDKNTVKSKVCDYYGVASCSNEQWE